MVHRWCTKRHPPQNASGRPMTRVWWGERGVLNPACNRLQVGAPSRDLGQKSSVLEYLTIPAFPAVSQAATKSCGAQMVHRAPGRTSRGGRPGVEGDR